MALHEANPNPLEFSRFVAALELSRHEFVEIENGSILKSIILQKTKSNGYFYKNISGIQDYNSSYQSFILSSGLKFNKIEINMNLEKEMHYFGSSTM